MQRKSAPPRFSSHGAFQLLVVASFWCRFGAHLITVTADTAAVAAVAVLFGSEQTAEKEQETRRIEVMLVFLLAEMLAVRLGG